MLTSLSELKINESGYVSCLENKGAMRRRLQDIGLIPGTKVKCALISPLGDTKAYEIRGTVIAIRDDDAKKIYLD